MAIKATLHTNSNYRVSINNQEKKEIRTVNVLPRNTNKLRSLEDVDASSLNNNETLVYDADSDKFVVKELPVVNGGTF